MIDLTKTEERVRWIAKTFIPSDNPDEVMVKTAKMSCDTDAAGQLLTHSAKLIDILMSNMNFVDDLLQVIESPEFNAETSNELNALKSVMQVSAEFVNSTADLTNLLFGHEQKAKGLQIPGK